MCRKFNEKKKLDTKEFLWNQEETKISEWYNLINETKLWYQMMRTSWSHGHAKTPIPGKPCLVMLLFILTLDLKKP
jgi:hypothetical protein